MIAYNKTFLENTFLVSEATNLKESGFIQEADLSKIKVDFEALKTNKNVFVRFGFFLLGSFLFSSIIGFISLLFSNSFDSVYKVIGFIFFLAGFLVLELLCKEKIFRHGLDDAFIIGTQMCFYISVYVVTESQIAIAISMIVVGLIYTLRYVSSLSFVVFLSGIVYLISVLLINYSTISSVLVS